VSAGSFFTDSDVSSDQRVCVIGQTVASSLFGESDPIGATIKINNRTVFRIVGVLTSKGTNGVQDQDDVVMAPITSVQTYVLGRVTVNQISVQATSKDTIAKATSEVTQALLNRHGISDVAAADFQVRTQEDLITARTQATDVFTVLLAAVAAISLLVGGIGIMNIMLVTVTERTREIGIRKALGARRRDILGQFLVESMLLSGIGGALGVLAGVVGSRHVPSLLGSIAPVVRTDSVVLAFSVAVCIGLFFGIYPANRAAALRPIDALRYE
jgi:putative ABC transport system permease protein